MSLSLQQITSNFIHVLVNIGNEELLKREISQFFPNFHLSFSKKGFLTFKTSIPLRIDQLPRLNFARRVTLGQNKGDLSSLLRENTSAREVQLTSTEETEDKVEGPILKIGQEYVQLIRVNENEYWSSVGRLNAWEYPTPGGYSEIILPKDSPSRTYLKAATAVSFFNIPLNSSQTLLELGSSPGGTSFFFLNMGLSVWGIDPGEMAKQCVQFKQFHHLKICSQELSMAHLPPKIDWIVCDMNLAPAIALKQTARIVQMASKKYLKGVFFTVKVPDQRFIEQIPNLLKLANELFPWPIETVQFSCHKNEFLLVSLAKNFRPI